MQRGTKEYYDVMDSFERTMRTSGSIPNVRLDRVAKDEKSSPKDFYESGETNVLFHAFMAGYAAAKCQYQN